MTADTPHRKRVKHHHDPGHAHELTFSSAVLARKYRLQFPKSLDGAPMLLPMRNTSLRRAMDQWFDSEGIQPKVIGEFEDSALLKVFGTEGTGLFAAPSAIEEEICRQYRVRPFGEMPKVHENTTTQYLRSEN